MKTPSLMTINMFMYALYVYKIDNDMEGFRDNCTEIYDMAANSGYACVDVTSWELDMLGANFVMEELTRRNLAVGSLICIDQFADTDGVEGRIEKTMSYVHLAHKLGTDVVMLAPQAPDNIDALTAEDIRTNLIRHFTPIAACAKNTGLHIVIEDTPDLRLHLCTASDVAAVLDAVAGLELVYDSGNMLLVGESPVIYLCSFAGRIGYVHLKDMRPAPEDAIFADTASDGSRMSVAPTGTGIVDLQSVMDELKRQDYCGGIAVEFYVDDDRDFLKSLVRTREYAQALMNRKD